MVCAPGKTMMSSPAQFVWVVGAGFLGGELVRCCGAEGSRVISIDSYAEADVRGEAQRADTLQLALQKGSPQVVYSCTATHGGDAAAYRRCYAEVARQIVRQVPTARVVFCSTCSVYEERSGAGVTEVSACPGREEKMRAILSAERSVLDAGGVVARLAALYGPGRCEIVRRYVQEGEQLPGGKERWVNYVHVADAAKALMMLAQCGAAGQVYNVSGQSLQLGTLYSYLDTLCVGCARRQNENRRFKRTMRASMRVCTEKIRAIGWTAHRDIQSFAQSVIEEIKPDKRRSDA